MSAPATRFGTPIALEEARRSVRTLWLNEWSARGRCRRGNISRSGLFSPEFPTHTVRYGSLRWKHWRRIALRAERNLRAIGDEPYLTLREGAQRRLSIFARR